MDNEITENERTTEIETATIEPTGEDYLDYTDVENDDVADTDYTPATKKSGSRKTIRAKSNAKKTSAPKRKTPLKKEIELPMKIDLINLVKAERSLYNLKDPSYSLRIHKDKKWSEICDAMKRKYPELTVEVCKKMWSSVRESTR